MADPRELERDRVRRAHDDHILNLCRQYHEAGDCHESLRELLKKWQPNKVQPPDDPMAHEPLQAALRNHVRHECRVRRAYCPSSMRPI